MKKLCCLLSAMIAVTLLVLSVNPLQAADLAGKWALSLHGGAYKLALTDHSDIWTVGWLGNVELKYGLSPSWMIGAEGDFMQTYLADLTAEEREDGAGITTKNVKDGPRQRDYVAGLLAQYHFMPDAGWSPFVSFGTGVYIWNWTNKDMENLVSWDPALSGTQIPPDDKAGDYYHLKDQELYGMVGAGLEFFPSQSVSLELGGKFRYLTHVFTNFTDDKDIVGTGLDELDLPKGIVEVYAGLTFLFGGTPAPALDCMASADPKSGPPPLTVQFEGSANGGHPPYGYSWDFGEGGSSRDQNPNHTYERVGNYGARLTVTDSKGTSSQSGASISVTCPSLTCTASANPTSGTVPLMVRFDATVSGGCPPYTYNWNTGDGGSSSEQNPSRRIEDAGSYTASLTVTDSQGNRCQESASYQTLAEEFIPTPEKPVILQGVNFEFDKAILLENSLQILDRVATSLLAHPEVNVEVGGHCDSDGSDAYNLKLSDRRAKAVRDYLIKKGVPAAQLTSRGYGESHPIADNNTAEGRAINRRVELKRT